MKENFYRFFCLFLCFVITSCAPSETQVKMITSPDQKVDVIITEMNTNATVSPPTKIYIVPKNKQIDDENLILLADHFELKDIKWVTPKDLVISFTFGRIFKFNNIWVSREVENRTYKIRAYLDDQTQYQ